MQRRKALATAASVSAIALTATIALGANVGLFGLTSHDNGPGTFQLVDSKTPKPVVRTEIVDVPVTTPDSVANDGTSPTPTVGAAPRSDDDHKDGDDDHKSDDDSHKSDSEHDEDD